MYPLKDIVYVTRELPQRVMTELNKEFNVIVNSKNRLLTKNELISELKTFNPKWIVSLLTDPIDKDVMSSINLKGIAQYAVGIDNIDIEYARKNKILVSNTPGVLTETTADLTWALLMSITRRIVESDSYCREGKFDGWAPKLLLGIDVYGKTLGIIGMGRIGQAVAKRAKGFGMRVIYSSRTRKEILESKFAYENVDLKRLFKESDIISLHIPYTKDTHELINKEVIFEMMKKTAIIINTSRGKNIDEEALVKALQSKRIAGAALDVFYNEPSIHPDLLKLKNVILAPHIGSASVETREKMGMMVLENLNAMKVGKIPPNNIE